MALIKEPTYLDPWTEPGTYFYEDRPFEVDGIVYYPPAYRTLAGHQRDMCSGNMFSFKPDNEHGPSDTNLDGKRIECWCVEGAEAGSVIVIEPEGDDR